jgi:hypothetical protein
MGSLRGDYWEDPLVMTAPNDKPNRLRPPFDEEDELYALKPVEPPAAPLVPQPISTSRAPSVLERISAETKLPPPPRWPMLSGVFTFPFYLGALAAWMFITLGLMATGWLLLFWLGPGAVLGLDSARLFGIPTCTAGLLTLGYAASCCLIIIEQTANGWNAIEVSPEGNWKEWVWNYAHLATIGLQALMVGAAVRLATSSPSWFPLFAGTFVAFPIVLLGALAAEGAWVPLAITKVLCSVPRLFPTWLLFYLETAVLIVGWTWLVATGFEQQPWFTPLYGAPVLAMVILIYARLVGRLAACIATETAEE